MNPMSYFLLALTTVLAATANANGPPVLDVYGRPILGGSYYILPAFFSPVGGGLTLVPNGGNQECPLYIGQSSAPHKGTPVKFSNWMSKVGFVPESANLNIEMDVAATICIQSTYWWVVPSNSPLMSLYVAGGPKPEHEEDSTRSFFQIKKSKQISFAYNIEYCPNDNGCMDVGISTDDYGVRRLALLGTTQPFPFVFMKAGETDTSSKTI